MALDPAEGDTLARLAVDAVAAQLSGRALTVAPPGSEALAAAGACFVTLEVQGLLRGCIGTMQAARPLYLDVVRNAKRATRDPRLPPVTAEEWAELDIKVSVLSALEPIPAGTLAELIAVLRPGVDGLLVTDTDRRATFLPAVWERLPRPATFVGALLSKGGWPPRGWPAGLRASRYTSAEYHAVGPHAALPPADSTAFDLSR
jgi:AmmeMemoRadiSam system protein A